jgi:hypothetical protein
MPAIADFRQPPSAIAICRHYFRHFFDYAITDYYFQRFDCFDDAARSITLPRHCYAISRYILSLIFAPDAAIAGYFAAASH